MAQSFYLSRVPIRLHAGGVNWPRGLVTFWSYLGTSSLGVVFEVGGGQPVASYSTGLVPGMGWMAVIAAKPLYESMFGEWTHMVTCRRRHVFGGVIFFLALTAAFDTAISFGICLYGRNRLSRGCGLHRNLGRTNDLMPYHEGMPHLVF